MRRVFRNLMQRLLRGQQISVARRSDAKWLLLAILLREDVVNEGARLAEYTQKVVVVKQQEMYSFGYS